MSYKVYSAQMYSLKELPREIRGTFAMPADPYMHSALPAGVEALEILRKLGVVFYRDEFTSEGLLLQPEDGDPTPMSERSGFLAYKSSLRLETDEKTYLRISSWPKPTQEYVEKKGDAFAWIEWNRPYNVVSMQPEAVSLT